MNIKSFAFAVACTLLVGCDSSSTETVRGDGAQKTETAIYFPDGGGIDFSKAAISQDKGEGWAFNEYILDQDWPTLYSTIYSIMKEQGYTEEAIKYPDFQGGVGYFKKDGKGKKVFYRYKFVKTAAGEKLLLRVSWYR